MARKPTRTDDGSLVMPEIKVDIATSSFTLVGTTPLIMHRMSRKVTEELLFPSPKKNTAERAQTLKHVPLDEFRESLYLSREGNDKESILHFPEGGFKQAIAAAALEVPGAFKSQIGRLTSIADTHISIFGIPQVYMCIVRQSGPARTPDVRTRAILPRWACTLRVKYLRNSISDTNIAGLLNMAGIVIGIGDNRPAKGAGSFGQFRIADKTDKEFQSIIKNEGRQAQLKAVAKPQAFDLETEDLLAWFDEELVKRDRKPRPRVVAVRGKRVAA